MAEYEEALKEVSKEKQRHLSDIKHQEKLLAEEIAKREMEKQEQYARAAFADCDEDCIEKALQFIGVAKSASIEKDLTLWRNYTQLFMGSIGFEPNKR